MNYVTLYLAARRSLNWENIEKLTAKQIDHIGKMYDPELFEHFKKSVFFRWFNENTTNTTSFIKRSRKLLKKLDLDLSQKDMERINNIEPREFTERRAMKTIEVPYKDLREANMLDSDAFFFYKDVRLYRMNKTLYRQDHKGEIYITKNEMVFYDRDKNTINEVINFNIIEEVTLRKYGVEVQITDEQPVYIRYKDNELIFISLSRSLPAKVEIDFLNTVREESDTIERTIEAILDA